MEVLWTYGRKLQSKTSDPYSLSSTSQQFKNGVFKNLELEAPPGFEPGMEVLQIS